MKTTSGTQPVTDGYPIVFTGPSGAVTVLAGSDGSYSVTLQAGTYVVTDGYADSGCALPAVVTPGTVQVVAFA
ncbi:MAG: hypothetical protein ABI782_08300, partial [Anaerolineaceae bacterium]